MDLYVATFADLMNGEPYAEIIDLVGGTVVRRLSVAAGKVQIDCFAPPVVCVDLNTPIIYEPWRMDRGSLLFSCAVFPDGTAKICTEFDVIRFRNGTEYKIKPM